ncbi:MAG: dihydrolipoyl dehydrogenase [Clostridiales bacterium]|nr:dihydrolipoyl dehydrogenase [Clostridiales bacterium]
MKYQWIIIGAGPGGYQAAIRAAQLEQNVLLIEQGDVGGTCLNLGCIPTKSLLHSAQSYKALDSYEQLGIQVEKWSYDLEKIYERKTQVVETLRKGVESLIKQNRITFVAGKALVTGEKQVMVNNETYTGEKILVATGSVPARIPIEGVDLPNVITSDELLKEPFTKEHLLIIGGGVIGVEFAGVYSALGKQVTIIEGEKRILPLLDREISQNTAMLLKRNGVKIYTGAKVQRIENTQGLACVFEAKEQEERIQGDTILLAVGRKANTTDLFKAPVSPGMERGYIVTDELGQTNYPWLYAIGDVTGGLQLAHRASAQGINCVENALGIENPVNQNVIPSCVYTKPEIAVVGLTQEQAQEEGIETVVGKYVMSGNGRTIIEMGDRGFIKLVFDKSNEVLLGAHLMCERATDMIDELTLAVANGLTKEELLRAIRPHPTFCEGITEAIEGVDGKAIHVAPVKKR